MPFTHLHVHSPFSFLDGASSTRDLVSAAAAGGMAALAITDLHSVSAAAQLKTACEAAGLKPIHGAEVLLGNGFRLVLLAESAAGYQNLCRLLTKAHLEHPRLKPCVDFATLARFREGLIALSGDRHGELPARLQRGETENALQALERYGRIFGKDHFFLELQGGLLPGDRRINAMLGELAEKTGFRCVASGSVRFAAKEAAWFYDLLCCVRLGLSLDDLSPERPFNAEQHLFSAGAAATRFAGYPQALRLNEEIAARCSTDALSLSGSRFPAFKDIGPEAAAAKLRADVFAGARWRYGKLTAAICSRLEHELEIITRLGYADYFLIVADVARWSRAQGIRISGRGSAADSAAAYCLGITDVDAIGRGLLFERFMSLERAEAPDIDVDIDARRRDDVAAYVERRYGKQHVAAVATYQTFQARSSLRDFGKVIGLPAEVIDGLAKRVPYYVDARHLDAAVASVPELRALAFPARRLERLWEACALAANLPRHLGTHLGGVVISRAPVTDISPLQMSAKGVTVCQFDKRDIETLGLLKLDLLSLRTLSAVDDTLTALHRQDRELDYDRIPAGDADTYRRLRSGETVGIFQLESPAQRALQTRLGAENLEDIVASTALIRPGPIKGNMVDPFVARRRGLEPVTYPDPRLEPILRHTYGVVVYQEQVIQIATILAGFTPGEADRLRRVMSHARSAEDMEEIGSLFIEKAIAHGTTRERAEEIFAQLKGYASYGFCEAHAAAFGTLAYKTAYLLEHHATEFFAAILSSEPMGYYPANTIANEARRRGVALWTADVNKSSWSCTVQDGGIRLGLCLVKSLGQKNGEEIVRAREKGAFMSLDDVRRRLTLPQSALEALVQAGALDALGRNRRQMLWEIRKKKERRMPGTFDINPAPLPSLADFTPVERYLQEYDQTGVMAKGHLFSFLRPRLKRRNVETAETLRGLPDGTAVRVAGLPIRPHRPPTRSGRRIVFLSLEDETGLADLTLFEDKYKAFGHLIFTDRPSPLLAYGVVRRRGEGASLIVKRLARLRIGSNPNGSRFLLK